MSVAITRQLLWRMANVDDPSIAHDLESRALTALLAHGDSREGVESFKERRLPRFAGRASMTGFTGHWWD